MVTCGGCGAALAAGDRFCVDCGAAAVLCPACGEPAAPSNRFCRACGLALTGAASGSPAARSAPPVAAPLMQRAERDLVRARLAASDGDPGAAAAFAAAVTGLREHFTPYHLAHGLLDHAADLPAAEPRRARTMMAPAPEESASARGG